ncbi:MAG: hypothetical protein Q8L64_05515 [bacterium]|nr:hypothetical protein [bacterium]
MNLLSQTSAWMLWVAVTPIAVAILIVIMMSTDAKDWMKSTVAGQTANGKTIAILCVLITATNYIISKFNYEWWWALWLHGPFFMVNLAILLGCWISMSTFGKLAKVGAVIMVAFALAGWIKVAVESPTRAEIAAQASERQQAQVMVPTFQRIEDTIQVRKGEWSHPIVAGDIIQIQSVTGLYVRYDGKGTGKPMAPGVKNIIPFEAVMQEVRSTDQAFWIKYWRVVPTTALGGDDDPLD